MRRIPDTTMIRRCEHTSPVLIEEIEDGRIARCLACGESGPVHEKSEEALLALRDRALRHRSRRA